jgi:hypothetical protein
MEIIIKCFKVHSWNNIEQFQAKVNDLKYEIVKKNQMYQYELLVDILKDLKNKELIKSVFQPKNKRIQNELDNIVRVKRLIKRSLNQLKTAFN